MYLQGKTNTTKIYPQTSLLALFNRAARALSSGTLPLVLALCVLGAPHLARAQAPTVEYAMTNSSVQSTPTSFTLIPGLQITLPVLGTAGAKQALVTLNLPALYAETSGGPYPGSVIQVTVNGTQVAYGETSQPALTEDRTPISITVLVPLTAATQTVEGQWVSVNLSELSVGGFGSLSAILVK